MFNVRQVHDTVKGYCLRSPGFLDHYTLNSPGSVHCRIVRQSPPSRSRLTRIGLQKQDPSIRTIKQIQRAELRPKYTSIAFQFDWDLMTGRRCHIQFPRTGCSGARSFSFCCSALFGRGERRVSLEKICGRLVRRSPRISSRLKYVVRLIRIILRT
jgi:hypothetical protein